MSYLDKLKAKATPNPFEGFEGAMRGAVSAVINPFEGFEGDMRGAVSAVMNPFEGFEGDEGIGVCENQPSPPGAPASYFLERLQTKSESEVFRQKKSPSGLDTIPQTYPPQAPSKPSKACLDLHEPQADPSRCHVCGEREEPHRPFVAVLTMKPDERHWLHHGECHDAHRRECGAKRAAAAAGLDEA